MYYDLWAFCRYGVSPFEYALDESGGSLQLAIINAQVKWPAGPKPPYPEALHQFVTWMLQPQGTVRPRIDDIIIHVDKLVAKFSHWRIEKLEVLELVYSFTVRYHFTNDGETNVSWLAWVINDLHISIIFVIVRCGCSFWFCTFYKLFWTTWF